MAVLLCSALVSAELGFYDTTKPNIIEPEQKVIAFNNNTGSVNDSAYLRGKTWETNDYYKWWYNHTLTANKTIFEAYNSVWVMNYANIAMKNTSTIQAFTGGISATQMTLGSYASMTSSLFNLLVTYKYPTTAWIKNSYVGLTGEHIFDTGMTGMYDKNELANAGYNGNISIAVQGAGTITETTSRALNKIVDGNSGTWPVLSGANLGTNITILVDTGSTQSNYASAIWGAFLQYRYGTGQSPSKFSHINVYISLDGTNWYQGASWHDNSWTSHERVTSYWISDFDFVDIAPTYTWRYAKFELSNLTWDSGYAYKDQVWIPEIGIRHAGAPWSKFFIPSVNSLFNTHTLNNIKNYYGSNDEVGIYYNSTQLIINSSNTELKGNANFLGNITGNIYYGEMDNFTIGGYTGTPPATGIYVNVTNLVGDMNNGFRVIETGATGTKLQAQYSGVYDVSGKITWAIGNGGTYGFGIVINGQNPEVGGGNQHPGDCYSQADGLVSGGKTSMSVNCFYRLNKGDNLTAVYDEQTSPPKSLTIYKVEVNAKWLGN